MKVVPVLRTYGDTIAAVLLAAAMTVELLAWADDDVVRSVASGLLATLPFALRRRTPLAAFLLVMTGTHVLGLVQPGFDNDSMSFVAAFLWALYSLGRHARGLERWLGAASLVVVMVLFAQSEGGLGQADLGDLAFLIGFVGAPWAAGLTIALRREREAALNAENRRLVSEQEELARRAVAEERARIARELHDVVSHAISVTVLQARGARRMLGVDEQQVRRALDAIEQTNTGALGDMRRLLAVLRDTERDHGTEPEHDDRSPQPSLAHLDGLVEHVRSSGVPVEVLSHGAPRDVPPGVDLSAYRIVQEALTNVLKHARGAPTTVKLRYSDDELEVSVCDSGGPHGPPTASGSGHGLLGIRERVAVVGGEVQAGPRPGGGFEVRVRLPYSLEVPT